jgi:hypothetical protein
VREEECIQGSLWESWKERGHWEDLGIGGRLMLKIVLGAVGWDGVGWIHLA